MLRPTSMDHIALKVTDMDKTLHFYRDVLGLEVLHTSGPHANGGRSATVKIGDQRMDIFYRPDFVSADKDKPVGMDHVCLTIDNDSMEDVVDYLKRNDVEIMWGPVTRFGTTSVYVFDPDGIHVELRVPVVMEGAEKPELPAAAREPSAAGR